MPSAPDPQPPRLDYSNRPVVGVVSADRRDGGLTLTSLRDTSRLVRGAVLAVASLVLFATAYVLYRARHARGEAGVATDYLWLAFGGLSACAGALRDVVTGLHPAVLHFDSRRLTLTRRGLFEVHREEWEREWAVDLRTRRLRFRDTLARPFALVMALTNDAEVELLRGSRAEVEYAASQLREAMGLPPERWLEEGYPPPLRWAAVARTVSVYGVTLAFRPPRVPWLALVAAAPLIVTAATLVVSYITPDAELPRGPTTWTGWTLLQVAVFTLFGAVALSGVLYRVRRWTVVAVDDGRLLWSESGLRPGQAQWPLDEVAGFDAAPARLWKANMSLVLKDGRRVPLLRRRRTREVKWAVQNLQRAAQEWAAREGLVEPAESHRQPAAPDQAGAGSTSSPSDDGVSPSPDTPG